MLENLFFLSQLGHIKPTRTTNWPSGKLQEVHGLFVNTLCCLQYYIGVTDGSQSIHPLIPYRPETEPQLKL